MKQPNPQRFVLMLGIPITVHSANKHNHTTYHLSLELITDKFESALLMAVYSSVVERRSLTGELSLVHTGTAADG